MGMSVLFATFAGVLIASLALRPTPCAALATAPRRRR
jgi:hypothetical protein